MDGMHGSNIQWISKMMLQHVCSMLIMDEYVIVSVDSC